MTLHSFWRKTVFNLVIWGCGLFLLLTALAMLAYPGGTFSDPATHGYSFFENFFSDLGMSTSHSGQANPLARLLFTVAMNFAGLGMIFFFLAFWQFFRQEALTRLLTKLGSGLGVLAGVCFIGVAFTPHDLYLDAHAEFVRWAFRLFPLAVLCYALAMHREQYSRREQVVFVVFFGLLVAYLLLLEFGPSVESYYGMLIQAVGQKIIVFASIISVMIQASAARKLASK